MPPNRGNLLFYHRRLSLFSVSGHCSMPAPTCNYTLFDQVPTATFANGISTASYQPTIPVSFKQYEIMSFSFHEVFLLQGKYVFQFSATDLCTTVTCEQPVTAACPPSPIAKAVFSAGVTEFKLGETYAFFGCSFTEVPNQCFRSVTLSSDLSATTYAGGMLDSPIWTVSAAPAGSPYTVGTVLGNIMNFNTIPLLIAGDFTFSLTVNHGCSMGTTYVWFKVCNPSFR